MEETNIEIPAKFKDIVASIEKMSVLDLNELVKLFEKKFGVSAAAVAVAGPAAAVEAGDEKTAFNVELTDGGAQKIAVIKEVRALNSALGLKEAKDLVDATPATLLEKANKETADKAKAALEAAGAKVTIK